MYLFFLHLGGYEIESTSEGPREQAWCTDGVLKADKGSWFDAGRSCVLLLLPASPQVSPGYRSQQYQGHLCSRSL